MASLPSGPVTTFQYGNLSFNSLQDLIAYIESYTAADRWNVVVHIAQDLMNRRQHVDDAIEAFWDSARSNGYWRLHYNSYEQVQTQHAEIEAAVKSARERRKKKPEAENTLRNAWGRQNAALDSYIADKSAHFLQRMTPYTKRLVKDKALVREAWTFDEIIKKVNAICATRII